MKTLFTSTLLALFIAFPSIGQNIVGVATYKTDTKMDMKMDSTKVNADLQASLMAQLRKQMQKEFTLNFNSEESLYNEVEKLETPQAAPKSGIVISFSGGTDELYRNVKTERYLNEADIMGKPFLISDKTKKPNWELGKEIKNIGNYTCFKATWARDEEVDTFDRLTEKMVTKTETKVTTAWYTLDVPVQHGPSEFWGLPGLILEIQDGKTSILCSKVVINPEKPIEIEQPDKGKVVTQDEYDAIQKKKDKEMMEQFHQGKGRKKANSTSIQIGG